MPSHLDSTAMITDSTAVSDYMAFVVGVAVAVAFLAGRLLLGGFRGEKHLAVFTVDPNSGTAKDGLYCAVCLHDIAGGRRCRWLSECGHCFHADCIDSWLQSRLTCPLCRSQIGRLPQFQQRPCVFSYFLSFSRRIFEKMCNSLLNHEIASAFCDQNVSFCGK
ncbi:hypothetical protein NMG60_11023208 [Bertholletia excelsa]